MSRIARIAMCAAALCALAVAPIDTTRAQDQGSVQIPLTVYQSLAQGQAAAAAAGADPALGAADVQVDVVEESGQVTATVTVTMSARVRRDEPSLVPLLPAGVALGAASVDGQPVQLVASGAGLAWPADAAGAHSVELVYQVDGTRLGDGCSIALPLPPAPSSRLSVSIPGTGLGVAVLPATATRVAVAGDTTQVTATVPAGPGAQISWRRSSPGGFTLSRASYTGTLVGHAVRFVAELGVELATDGSATVPLLPVTVALADATLDRAPAPIAVEDDRFTVRVSGRGRHSLTAIFEVPVVEQDGLPGILLDLPQVPVSRFTLTLPGAKEVEVSPEANVLLNRARGQTIASFNTAMTEQVSVRWPEAVPDAPAEVEARANATINHVAHADEGVLYVRAITTFDVTHGSMSVVSLDVPPAAQVNSVEARSGGVSDWRVTGERDRVLTVYLDREVRGEITFEVTYERSITGPPGEAFDIPLLSPRDVHRQRGMIALLASRDLTLQPGEEQQLTRVGENQLPAAVRDAIDMTVAHTYRYVDVKPRLTATTAQREREQGRFDAQVNTLVSLNDVTTTGMAIVDVHVKTGSLLELVLELPEGVSLLDLSAPSLREHRVVEADGGQLVTVEFTQEMEGQFRVEASYERIFSQDESELVVPAVHVRGADVEQGRLAVEALTAVQVDPERTERLSPVDVSELPQQLILRTTNPILLAYRYAHAAPPPELALRVTRHAEISTQDATIDTASYRTLYTREGLAVTTARFTVRNQRRQFLRVALPPDSEVWSVHVNGQADTPAMASETDGDESALLVNIINSAEGFPVEIVYATRTAQVGAFGRVEGQLPQTDMIVTRTRWEVFMPPHADYGTPSGELTLVERGGFAEADVAPIATGTDGLPLTVPSEGIRFVFEKLYARSGEAFSIPYTSGWGSPVAAAMSLLGTLLVWLAALGLLLVRLRLGPLGVRVAGAGPELFTYRDSTSPAPNVIVRRGALAGLVAAGLCGVALLAVSHGYLATGPVAAVVLSTLFALGGSAVLLRDRVPRWIASVRARLNVSKTEPVPEAVQVRVEQESSQATGVSQEPDAEEPTDPQ